MKKRKWSGLKDGLIMYLAISKIMYWINVVAGMAQNDFEEALPFVIDRILTQDLPIILVVACMVVIDRSKGKIHTKLAIGYVAFIGISFVYTVAIQWIFQGDPMGGVLFFGRQFVGFTIQYVVITVILEVKEHFIKKVKEAPETENTPS